MLSSIPGTRILFVLLLLAVMGCGPENANEETSDATDSAAAETVEPMDAADVKLMVVNRAAYDEVIASHKGKIVLVDYWATWCPECVVQFPHTVKLSNDYSRDDLVVVSLSFDDPDVKESVAGYLAQQNATTENLLCETGASTASWEAFEMEGALPWYVLYDRDGKVAFRFSDAAEDPQAVEPTDQIDIRVRELVAKTSN